MTNQEQKYQEFRAMGYDHIQAREMTMKHFEVVSRCPECQAEKSEYDFASHMELCSQKIPLKETAIYKAIMTNTQKQEDWEKEFDVLSKTVFTFETYPFRDGSMGVAWDVIKSFIRALLAKREAEKTQTQTVHTPSEIEYKVYSDGRTLGGEIDKIYDNYESHGFVAVIRVKIGKKKITIPIRDVQDLPIQFRTLATFTWDEILALSKKD